MGYCQGDLRKASGFDAFRNENMRWFQSVSEKRQDTDANAIHGI